MKLRLIHIRENKKTGDLSGICSNGFKYAGTVYRVAYDIQENKGIPVLLWTVEKNNLVIWGRSEERRLLFYELVENTRNFIRVDESASIEL